MKTTPGPWVVKDERWIVATRGEHEGEILLAPTYWMEHAEEEAAANARLGAAAHDLLAALKSCPLPSSMGSAAEHYQRFYDWYQSVAVPAIRKAGGLA